MSEENKKNLDNEQMTEETTAEVTEEATNVPDETTEAAESASAAAFDVASAVETAAMETADEVSEDEAAEPTVDEENQNDGEQTAEDAPMSEDGIVIDAEPADGEALPLDWAAAEPVAKKTSKAGIIAIIAAIVIVVAALGLVGYMVINRNPYNKKYIDVTGRTVQEVAEGAGMELSEFLEMYSLPADMPANTSESAAYYSIPVGTIAQMNMMDFATLKQVLQLPDDITEQTTWGDVEDSLTVRQQVGEDGIEEFKQEYGLGDEVTGDTLWRDIRRKVDKVSRQKRIQEEKEAKKSIGGADGETDIDVTSEGDGAETNAPTDGSAPAEGEAAPAADAGAQQPAADAAPVQ